MEFIEDAAVRARLPRLSVWLTPDQYQQVCRTVCENRGSPDLPTHPAPRGSASTTGKSLFSRLRAAARRTVKRASPVV